MTKTIQQLRDETQAVLNSALDKIHTLNADMPETMGIGFHHFELSFIDASESDKETVTHQIMTSSDTGLKAMKTALRMVTDKLIECEKAADNDTDGKDHADLFADSVDIDPLELAKMADSMGKLSQLLHATAALMASKELKRMLTH